MASPWSRTACDGGILDTTASLFGAYGGGSHPGCRHRLGHPQKAEYTFLGQLQYLTLVRLATVRPGQITPDAKNQSDPKAVGMGKP